MKNLTPTRAKLWTAFRQHYLANPPQERAADAELVESLFAHTLAAAAGKTQLKVYSLSKHKRTYIDVTASNMPFARTSLQHLLSRQGLYVHSQQVLVLSVGYDKAGKLQAFNGEDKIMVIRLAVEEQLPAAVRDLRQHLEFLFRQLSQVTSSVRQMQQQLTSACDAYQAATPAAALTELDREKLEFIKWVNRGKCIWLGYQQFRSTSGKLAALGPGLGLCAAALADKELHKILSNIKPKEGISFFKLPLLSTIHRRVYIHCLSFGSKKGNSIEESRFLLLYSFNFFNANLEDVPYIKQGIAHQVQRLQLDPTSYRWRVLRYLLTSYPRDELLQLITSPSLDRSVDKLLEAINAGSLRVATYYDARGLFANTLVMVPREDYSTEVRLQFERLLRDYLKVSQVEFSVLFSEERLVRVFLTAQLTPESPARPNLAKLEQELIVAGTSWRQNLRQALLAEFGEEQGLKLFRDYAEIFASSYQENFSPAQAVADLPGLMRVGNGEENLALQLTPPQLDDTYRLRLIGLAADATLSNLVHILENTGVAVIAMRPYFFAATAELKQEVRLLEFKLVIPAQLKFAQFQQPAQQTLRLAYQGLAPNDGFNRLALSAAMAAEDIMLVRAWTSYLAQLQSRFAAAYIQETLCAYPQFARLLVDIFKVRFTADQQAPRRLKQQTQQFETRLEAVPMLEQDQILRYLLEVVLAITRTNFYLKSEPQTELKPYLSFKFAPKQFSFCSDPQPEREIFVYATDFEGVHLRAGPLARGGIRWSNKQAGYRQEVYQLLSAQIVKNAIIVPTGAKGGFYIKNPACTAPAVYRTFISALLELTDNYVQGKLVKAAGIKAYDAPDPYLVVAPDKGTAAFSDLANELAKEHNFWLGDAFASSGSSGYSHKDMGITARGAWEAVKRNFAELGLDANQDEIEVIGVGDMSGDVFGNGMLLSKTIKLICAFDHRHIFIDPNPDPRKSFKERQRLFALASSSWQDYRSAVLSPGGQIFSRQDKQLKLNKQLRQKFGIKETSLSPNQLIRRVLQAPADLLWFGGIGTYVKGREESHGQLEDKANDEIRVNGRELRVKVIGEGANLGATLAGRIEFARAGGLVATDANDNSGGVHCSDREVNIKIFLSLLQEKRKLTAAARLPLLKEMTEEVALDLLQENFLQNLALSLETQQAADLALQHNSLATNLQASAALHLGVTNEPLTRPQLADLFGNCKNWLREVLADCALEKEAGLRRLLVDYFPSSLSQHANYMPQHSLARELVTTQVANLMVNGLGLAFWAELIWRDDERLVKYVRQFFSLDAVFGWTELLRQLAQEPRRYPAARAEIIKARQNFILLLNYAVQQTRPATEELQIPQVAVTPANSLSAQTAQLAAGINLLMQQRILAKLAQRPLGLPPNELQAKLVRLMAELEQLLPLDLLLQELNSYPISEDWQARGVHKMCLEILAHRQQLLQRLLPGYLKSGASSLRAWQQAQQKALASYSDSFAMLKTRRDISIVSYILFLLRDLEAQS